MRVLSELSNIFLSPVIGMGKEGRGRLLFLSAKMQNLRCLSCGLICGEGRQRDFALIREVCCLTMFLSEKASVSLLILNRLLSVKETNACLISILSC